jgi:hypothetical protein
VTLSAHEARELYESLEDWAEGADEGRVHPEWHTHITDAAGNELTIAISVDGDSRQR